MNLEEAKIPRTPKKRKHLRDLRRKLGLRASEIAYIFGCTEQTVYKKEKPNDAEADMTWFFALSFLETQGVAAPTTSLRTKKVTQAE